MLETEDSAQPSSFEYYWLRNCDPSQVLFCSIVSWIKTDDPSSVEYWSRGGDWDYFKKVVDVRGAPSVAGKLSFDDMGSVGQALFLFLFVDFMDTSGTLYAIANYADMLDAKGNFEGRTSPSSSTASPPQSAPSAAPRP